MKNPAIIYIGENISSKTISDIYASYTLAGEKVILKEMKYLDNDHRIKKTQPARK
jgi:hypothetical protein